MYVSRVKIINYRCLRNVDVLLNKGMNIIVGDNEAGKSTFLEAIHLALTGFLYGRPIAYELHPFVFNAAATAEWLASLTTTPKALPEVLIELYFDEDPSLEFWRGKNNSLSIDCPGISLAIQFNEDYREDYQQYISKPDGVTAIPIEYYKPEWIGFHGDYIAPRKRPLRSRIVDASTIRNNSLATRYISEIIQELPPADRVDLSLSYRQMRSRFLQDDRVQSVNKKLASKKIGMSDKKLSFSLDTTSRTNWELGILPHLDEIPMPLVGKGEQNSVKIRLAIDTAEPTNVILVEEPENHLSHGNLGRVLADIQKAAKDRQVIVTSHSSFVINKLGVDAVLLFAKSSFLRLSGLPSDTRDYFMKLPGYDTLRLILASRCILVEGPSDELVVQKAYYSKNGRMPQDDGIDIISVRSLAFKRFLEVAKPLGVRVIVVTDNDGKPERVTAKYAEYVGDTNIKICFSKDPSLKTLEPHMLQVNGLETLNQIFQKQFASDNEMMDFMMDDKTGWALLLLRTEQPVKFPAYIQDAIA